MESTGASSNHVGNSVNIEGRCNTAIANHYGDNYYQSAPQPNHDAGLSGLKKHVAFSALHDSEARYPQPNVLPGTREEILGRLSSWCEDPHKLSRVFWVHGAAGAGKSAIAQSLSEKYSQTGQLAAAFFFSRNDPTRDKLEPFIATIAYQLATSKVLHPHLAPLIIQIAYMSLSEVLHKQVESQFQMLVAEPSAQVNPRLWTQLPRLIIIDGVDECIRVESQKRLLKLIKAITPTLPLDFLIFSRPEPHISHIFHHQSFTPVPFCLNLGDFAESVQDDIKKYLYNQFAHIQEEHWHILPHPQSSWPGNSVIAELLNRATGQFIYATTVMKYINHGKLPLTPMQRLDVILQARRVVKSSSPYPELDQLYTQILQFCNNEERKLQQVLQLIVSTPGYYQASETAQEGLSDPSEFWYDAPLQLHGTPDSVGCASLWALEHYLKLDKGEASVLLSGLHSILDVPTSQVENVVVLHASFSEFLLDPHRAGEFYVGIKISSKGWKQLTTAFKIHMLHQFCMESDDWPSNSDNHPVNGIQNIDIGSLNVWWTFLQDLSKQELFINKEIATALNNFDPHIYLSALLYWYFTAAGYTFLVSRFPPQHRPISSVWGSHIAYVQTQILRLHKLFIFLKMGRFKIDGESCSIQEFMSKCSSFFQGFYVTFPGDEDKAPVRFNLLICQLSICIGHMWDYLPPYCFEAPVWYSKLNNRHNILMRILPSKINNGQSPSIPEGWEFMHIHQAEGDLLWKLLQVCKKTWMEKTEVMILSEMKDWTYELAQLDWENTKEIYLKARGLSDTENQHDTGNEGSSRRLSKRRGQADLGEKQPKRVTRSTTKRATSVQKEDHDGVKKRHKNY